MLNKRNRAGSYISLLRLKRVGGKSGKKRHERKARFYRGLQIVTRVEGYGGEKRSISLCSFLRREKERSQWVSGKWTYVIERERFLGEQ